MKKRTNLLALGVILSSQILPITAHANSIDFTAGHSESPPSSIIVDSNEIVETPNSDEKAQEAVDKSISEENIEVVYEAIEQDNSDSYDSISTTSEIDAIVVPASVTQTTWGTATAEFDDETGTLRVKNGVINGGWNKKDVPKGITVASIKHIIFEDDVSFGSDASYLFNGYGGLQTLRGHVNTSAVTEMNHMFYRVSSLQYADIGTWDTSNVTDMTALFDNAKSLKELNIAQWNTSKVTNMSTAFARIPNLEGLDLTQWDTSSVTDMTWMFTGSNLSEINLGTWNTSKVEDMEGMFYECQNLVSLDLSSWDTSKVGWMSYMFYDCTSLSSLTLGNYSILNRYGAFLPNIDTSSNEYTGRWINEESGQTFESSDDFLAKYDGTNPGTYVWEKNLPVTIDAQNSTIYVGDTWNPESNFLSATNSQGNPVTFDRISVEGSVDTSKVGTYPIIYTYDGHSTTVNVTVVEGQESLVTKDSTIDVGTKWDAKDNFVSATDRDGNPLGISDISVEGNVDTSKAGKYKVVYTWYAKDEAGNPTEFKITSEATITVVGGDEEVTTDDTDENDNNTTSGTNHDKSGNKSSSNLPSTGEQSSIISMTLGVLMLLFSGGMALFGLKKIKKKQNKI